MPAREDDVAGRDVAAARPNVRAALDRQATSTASSCSDNNLDRHDGVGALRHDAARRDRHRLAGLERRSAPGARLRCGRRPAAAPGVSAARSAKPSIAELGNGGRSTAARASSASTRPAASSSGTGSGGSGEPARGSAASASSIDSKVAMADAY